MKHCPKCGRTYTDETLNFCLEDGDWLIAKADLDVIVSPGEKQDLYQIPVEGGAGKQITNFEVPGIARREYSPDGKRIAIVRAERFGNAIMITGFR
jgi:hypothetical protein